MEQWQDEAILISVKSYGDNDLLAVFFTKNHGKYAGLIKGGKSRKNIGNFVIGNCLNLHWKARVENQLGFFKYEMKYSFSASIMDSKISLYILHSACALINLCIMERDKNTSIYSKLFNLLTCNRQEILRYYVSFELILLQECGFGLDLSCCVATGVTENLDFVSPKSGRAVCRNAALQYIDRMLILPQFLLSSDIKPTAEDIFNSLKLTGFFINKWLIISTGKKMPEIRNLIGNLIDL